MPPWEKVKLGDVCLKIGSGATPRGGESSYISHGISLVRSQNVLDYVFSKKGLVYITEQQANELSNVELKENDVLVNITGDSVARVCQVPYFILPARVNQHVAILRPNQNVLNSDYLKYSLLHPNSKYNLLTYASSGATRKALTKGMLEDFEIQIPDLPTQSRIASILSAFDDKIELNRQMNNTLEQMAQALFKKYFVTGIDPDNLPEGWRWGNLGEIIEISKTSICPSNFPDKIFLHYSIPAFDENKMALKELGISILSNKFIVKSNSILFSKLNPRFPRVWMIGNINESISICSTEFLVIKPKLSYWYSFIYQTLSSKILTDSLTSIATGTSGSHQRIRPDDILQTEIFIPSENDGIQFESDVRPLLNRIVKNNIESEILTNLRHNLLPKLMNGEISVDSLSLEESPEEIVA